MSDRIPGLVNRNIFISYENENPHKYSDDYLARVEWEMKHARRWLARFMKPARESWGSLDNHAIRIFRNLIAVLEFELHGSAMAEWRKWDAEGRP